jgi:phospho-N-acetylmuramoyl-pentapeptide-transferase
MPWDIGTFVVAFIIAFVLYPPVIRTLRRWKAGQVIQAELPESHQKKAGTPTGGGVLFVALGILGGTLSALAGHAGALPAVGGLLVGGLIGFFDDRSKLQLGARGIPARMKFPIQVVLAIPLAWIALQQSGWHQALLPSSPWLLLPLAVVAIVGAANAVNITDGMDGLAAGLSVIALVALALFLLCVAQSSRSFGSTVTRRRCSWGTPVRSRSASPWP